MSVFRGPRRTAMPTTEPEMNTGLWMVPYADLMSNLMILFLALFAYSYLNRSPEFDRAMQNIESNLAKEHEEAEAAQRLQEAQLAVLMRERLSRLALRDFGVRVSARYIHLSLPNPVLFPEGSERLNPSAVPVLAPLAELLATVDNPVLIAGHTDDVPIVGGHYRTNWELSAARAFSVIEFFAGQGLPPGRFQARGHGEFRPVAPNDTEANRARNRRIEIRLVREVKKQS